MLTRIDDAVATAKEKRLAKREKASGATALLSSHAAR